MNNDQIKTTIEHFKENGVSVRVRDIAYILLSHMFVDKSMAYKCLFGEEGLDEYAEDDLRIELEDYMTEQGFIRSVSIDEGTGEITFEENRKEMEGLLKKTQKSLEDGLIEPKDAFKIMADIRVKLNDKFRVESKQQDRLIVVEKKFDFVCPYTRRECYQLDKEDAMKKWNLIENPNDNGNE
jgi:hypothetical protein